MLYIYISPLLFNAVLGLVLALFLLRNAPAPGARALAALVFAASVWSTGYALEFLVPDLASKLFWAKFQYFGIAAIPVTLFVFSTELLSSPRWSARWRQYIALLAVVPFLTVCLVWTNEWHSLIWRQVQFQAVDGLQVLVYDHGPAFWIYLTYGYALLFWASIQLSERLFGSVRLQRWQVMLALLAIVIPWLGNLTYITGTSPVPYLDLTPFAFTLASLLFTITLFRFQIVNLLPIAQKSVFAGLADCILVLDVHNRIIDVNEAAVKMMGPAGQNPFGRPVAEVAPELGDWVAQAPLRDATHAEIARGEEPQQHFYDVRITPLTGPYPRPVGRLVVCHEITELKQQQARLERTRARLEQTVSERTEELSRTVEQLQHELAERTMAEERFEEVVESAPDAMLLVDRTGTIKLINAQAERLFGYRRDELVGQNVEILVPAHRREFYRRYVEQYSARLSGREFSRNPDLSARRKDGGEFPVELSMSALNTIEGVWIACNIRDISERREAEQAQNRLMEEIKQSTEQLRALTFRLQEVRESERREIAGELHDRIGQNLTALNLNLQTVRNQLNGALSSTVGNRLDDSLKLVEETTRQVRGVMSNLHPPMLDEYGLVPALQWYSNDFARRAGVAARVTGDEFPCRLALNVETVLFRLVQEALNNVAKHACATQVVIAVESSADAVRVVVEDNGRGFDPQELETLPAEPHWGLISMQQRAASIGGQLVIDSAPGRGTRVSVMVRRSNDGED